MKFDQITIIVFSVMADTRFVSDKPLTLDCDLDLGRGNLNAFYMQHTFSFTLSFCEV